MFVKSKEENERTAHWLKEAQKGYIRIAVLMIINMKPAHGYEIMREIKDRTKGFWKPTAGGVYPILRDLDKSGYIEGEWSIQNNRRIKTYRISETGLAILKKAIVKQSEIADNMNTLFREFARDVLNLEQKDLPIPVFPTPFSPFLQERKMGADETEDFLERKRVLLKRQIKALQKELQTTNKKIAKSE